MNARLLVDMAKRPFAYADVYRHGYGGEAKNEGNCTVFLADGSWLTTWSQGSGEDYPDERIVGSLSHDMGRTWSKPFVIQASDPANELHVGRGIPFVVPETGRVYVFFFRTVNTDTKAWLKAPGLPLDGASRRYPEHGSGHLCFVCSDDNGRTWSEPRPIPLPRRELYSMPDRVHGWLSHPPRTMPTGEVVLSFTGYQVDLGLDHDPSLDWPLRPSESNLLVCDNILSERDPDALTFTQWPAGPHGIRVDPQRFLRNDPLRRFCEVFFGDPLVHGVSFEEMSVVALSDGRWVGVGRTKLGCPCYAVSRDRGRTWTSPEPLRFRPASAPIPHPMVSCPLSTTSDGRHVLLFTNNHGTMRGAAHLWDTGHVRNPQWIAVAREAHAETNAGLWFGDPIVVAEAAGSRSRQDTAPAEVSTAQFIERKGRFFVAYSLKKRDILIDEIPANVLDGITPRW